MTFTRLARAAGTGTAAGLLVLTAACGSASSGGSSDAGSSDSGASSDKGSGGSAASSLTTSDIFSKLTDAQKDKGSYTFSLTTSAAGQETKATGEADVSGDVPAVHVSTSAAGQAFESISTGGLIYIKGAGFGTDKWIKIDPKDKTGPGALFGSASGDPATALKALQGAAKVTKGGSSQVDGVDTTEYDVAVDTSAMIKSQPQLSKLGSALPKTVTYKVFVDGDDLLRKLTNELSFQGQKITTEVDFTDYGKDVSVEAPPASQTTTDFKLPGMTSSS